MRTRRSACWVRHASWLVAALAAASLLISCTDSTPRSTVPEPGATVASRPTDTTPPGEPAPPADQADHPRRHVAWRHLKLRPGWGPDWNILDRATNAVQRLPLEDLAGQVIIARYRGTGAPLELVNELHLGGVVSFESNLGDAEQVRVTNAALQRGVRRAWPVWIGVDQEGGRVTRVQDGITPFPNQMALGAVDDVELTRRVNEAIGQGLATLGFNVDFAPVADVTAGAGDVTIRARSFGDDPEMVGRHATEAARALWTSGVIPVVKHFPGHGAATEDSHVSLPEISRRLRVMRHVDMEPFRVAVQAGVPAVMVGHLAVPALDPRLPASLSPVIIDEELRGRLGFDGLVVSDALDMGAVAGNDWDDDPAVLTLLAGGDVVLMPADPAAARAAIVAAVTEEHLARARLEQAAARQIALLLLRQRELRRITLPSVDGDGVATELARRSLVLIADRCSGALIEEPISPKGNHDAVQVFVEQARRAELTVGKGGTTIRFVGWDDSPPRSRGSKGLQPDVLVSVADATVLGKSDAPVRVAAWGWTPATMTALIELLQGHRASQGSLPVVVQGLVSCASS